MHLIFEGGVSRKMDGVEDMDFFVGDAAQANSSTYQINYPIRKGIIDNWDNMERLWQVHIYSDTFVFFILVFCL